MDIPDSFTTTESSVIAGASYTAAHKALIVVLVNGRMYRYGDVPVSTWIGFYRAPSRGKFYARAIKGQYQAFEIKPDSVQTFLATMAGTQPRTPPRQPTLPRARPLPDNVVAFADPKWDALRGRSRYDVYLASLRFKGIIFAEHAKQERERNNAAVKRQLRTPPRTPRR